MDASESDPGCELDDDLRGRLRAALRVRLAPRHVRRAPRSVRRAPRSVPDGIHQGPGMPRTSSGQKLEIPVRKILLGTIQDLPADPNALADLDVLGAYAGSRAADPSQLL